MVCKPIIVSRRKGKKQIIVINDPEEVSHTSPGQRPERKKEKISPERASYNRYLRGCVKSCGTILICGRKILHFIPAVRNRDITHMSRLEVKNLNRSHELSELFSYSLEVEDPSPFSFNELKMAFRFAAGILSKIAAIPCGLLLRQKAFK